MGKDKFREVLKQELERIDGIGTTKRHEHLIEKFEDGKAIIDAKPVLVFNSNDYVGLRHHPKIKQAEVEASESFGAGPGGVRFICGSMKVHRDLEKALAKFHGREDGIIFSSAFAANLAVLHCVIKGQSKDSLVQPDTLVISDQLNHRSIIDGIRVAGLDKAHKMIFPHQDLDALDTILTEQRGKFRRVLIVSDGVFSMVGAYQDIGKLQAIADKHDEFFEEGVITCIDDSHGVAAFGATGRGCEEVTNGKCDLLLATMGKGFGSDGGYVVGDRIFIDYLRESAATYIYSNPISPGTAGAALASVNLLEGPEGKELLAKLESNVEYFKEQMEQKGFQFIPKSIHPIQPWRIGDPMVAKKLTQALFEKGVLVTNISYPVVPKGKDEIRVQLSAAHSKEDIDSFVSAATEASQEIGFDPSTSSEE